MGLFDFLKKKKATIDVPAGMEFKSDREKEMYINNTMGYRDTKNRVYYHDKLYKRIGEIHAKYAGGSNNAEYMQELENIIQTDPESESSVWDALLKLYIDDKQYNKAWAYSNKLILNSNVPTEKVRHEQVRILKKEKKYIPATDMIMAEHLLKYSNRINFNRNAFIKDAGVCTRVLKWDESMLEDMANILETQLKKKDYDEGHLHNSYKKYLQSKGIIMEE